MQEKFATLLYDLLLRVTPDLKSYSLFLETIVEYFCVSSMVRMTVAIWADPDHPFWVVWPIIRKPHDMVRFKVGCSILL